MEIKEINISGVSIPDVTVVDPGNYSSPPIPVAPPVTVNIGVPIVDIPGCVEAHETNNQRIIRSNLMTKEDWLRFAMVWHP